MQSKSLFTIIVAALLLLAGAYALLGERRSTPDDSAAGQRLFPGLEQRLNDISRIRIEHRGQAYELAGEGGQWQLPSKGDYPVQFERVKPLLLGIALLEKIEPKTSNPDNYARIGVQEPAADSYNMRVELYANGGTPVASLIVGKIRGGLIAGGRDGIYARKSGESRSWLVAGELALPASQLDWIDRQIVHIKPRSVKRVTITQPDGSSLVLEKPYQGAVDYRLSNLPEGVVLESSEQINPLARSLAGLKMEELLVRSEAGLPEAEAVVTVFETWDGMQVAAYSVEQEGRILAWFDVQAAPLQAADLGEMRTTDPGIAELQARLDGWVYQLPRARGEKLRKRLDDVLKAEGT